MGQGMGQNSYRFHDHQADLAGVHELGVNLTVNLGPHVQLGGGYNLMFIHGVAQSLEQVRRQIDTNGSIFMHGPSAFFVVRW
jgi:hypothetical protein